MSVSCPRTGRVRKAVATMGALGVPLATATPAAAATCSGTGCAGADAQASGWASDGQTIDARDIRSNGGLDLVIKLRYSLTCKALWTRAVAGTGLNYDFGNTHYAQMRGYATTSSSPYYRYNTDIEPGTATWTKTIPSYWGEPCLVWPNPTSEHDAARWSCTPRH
ncbi:hypothetical protein GCM10020367_58750 [Streptomyces sannanensis]|uniref:DUF2690 domain-containing protein n=1 Tax=Streptomyces sannanensis TaxID=285536 RepID=A0ABP6SKC4_9ACTN